MNEPIQRGTQTVFIDATGDIFKSPADALVNPVNTVGVMGKGLAAEFARRFPKHLDTYRAACRSGRLRPGRVLTTYERGKTIICLPTKRHWRERSRLADIRSGARALAAEIEQGKIESVAVPALGSGLGQLDYRRVKAVIKEELKEAAEHCDIYLYPPGPGNEAQSAPPTPEGHLDHAIKDMRRGRPYP